MQRSVNPPVPDVDEHVNDEMVLPDDYDYDVDSSDEGPELTACPWCDISCSTHLVFNLHATAINANCNLCHRWTHTRRGTYIGLGSTIHEPGEITRFVCHACFHVFDRLRTRRAARAFPYEAHLIANGNICNFCARPFSARFSPAATCTTCGTLCHVVCLTHIGSQRNNCMTCIGRGLVFGNPLTETIRRHLRAVPEPVDLHPD